MVKLPLFLFSIILFFTLILGCKSPPSQELRILIDPRPATLNPRQSLDATGQNIAALIFRGLVRFDPKFKVIPDLAEKWKVEPDGRKIHFFIVKNIFDHLHHPITAEKIAQCLENYRIGKPVSPLASAFPNWKKTAYDSSSITIELTQPDPYFLNNISLLKYFSSEESFNPCEEPEHFEKIVGSGAYLFPKNYTGQNEMTLEPAPQYNDVLPLHFFFILDDITKMLKLIRGEVDVAINAISPSQKNWLEKKYSDTYKLLDQDGTKVSYLSFNLLDPILKNKEVRKAIALSIPRNEIIEYKLKGMATLANTLLSPMLPESISSDFPYNPKKAEEILDTAGYPRTPHHRFILKYKTTPAREGVETAKMIQNALEAIGIHVIIEVVEPSVFYASIRKKSFQLASSRWLGIKDASILYKVLRSGQASNRSSYSDPEMDRLLDQLVQEPEIKKRLPILRALQKKSIEDLPFFPLWFWNNTFILKRNLKGMESQDIPLSGSLEPLLLLRK